MLKQPKFVVPNTILDSSIVYVRESGDPGDDDIFLRSVIATVSLSVSVVVAVDNGGGVSRRLGVSKGKCFNVNETEKRCCFKADTTFASFQPTCHGGGEKKKDNVITKSRVIDVYIQLSVR